MVEQMGVSMAHSTQHTAAVQEPRSRAQANPALQQPRLPTRSCLPRRCRCTLPATAAIPCQHAAHPRRPPGVPPPPAHPRPRQRPAPPAQAQPPPAAKHRGSPALVSWQGGDGGRLPPACPTRTPLPRWCAGTTSTQLHHHHPSRSPPPQPLPAPAPQPAPPPPPQLQAEAGGEVSMRVSQGSARPPVPCLQAGQLAHTHTQWVQAPVRPHCRTWDASHAWVLWRLALLLRLSLRLLLLRLLLGSRCLCRLHCGRLCSTLLAGWAR
jgi:hypothetical protein